MLQSLQQLRSTSLVGLARPLLPFELVGFRVFDLKCASTRLKVSGTSLALSYRLGISFFCRLPLPFGRRALLKLTDPWTCIKSWDPVIYQESLCHDPLPPRS